MKKLVLCSLVALMTANLAFAADGDCAARAAEKKLSGAAKTSFMKKCEKDAMAKMPASAPVVSAQAGCEARAAEKKLKGAAKASFVKKCVKDASGAK
ncbi:PsiF family protein [Paludibacterium paludis]|uniref:PsiF repeat-containing protein n=1 Tax=Paludibacterium paludis TaxID=1225769 RepID=A0A918U6Y7_9NEIS|nr:hypothetical protein [Paludibacterium paludis]GGY03353.1 hypothetical protein GCM10011289_02060 [Paludibacterium paludis]